MGGPVGKLGCTHSGSAPRPHLGGRTLWLAVEGGHLAVERLGRGPAVVLLHGWTLDRRMWTMQARALAARHSVITVDRRGFGQSTAPADRAREVEDLVCLADRLELDCFHLVGMSQAGATAISYAQNHRNRLATLVLQGISLAGIPDHANASDRIPLGEFADLVRRGQLDAMKRQWAAHPLMAGLAGEAADIAGRMLADYDGRDLMAGPAGPSARLDQIATLCMPVLGITGVADTPWRRDITRAIGRSAPLGQARFIRDAGHMCNLSHPAEFNTALAAFLNRPLQPIPDATND